MTSFRKAGGIDTGGMPEKILALTEYDMALLNRLHVKKDNKMLIEKGAANIIAEYFMRFVDARARASHKRFHHVYEWDKTGDSNARLFKKNITPTPAGTVIKFSFTKSKEPNRNGHIFANKASVMEYGETVVIRPKSSKFLVYQIDGRQIVTSQPSVVENPGGVAVQGSFASEWKNFSHYQARGVLKQFKYFELINQAIKTKRKVVIPRISRGMISGMISEASKDASSIAMKAAVVSNV